VPTPPSQAAEPALQPDHYGDLLLAIDPDASVLTGTNTSPAKAYRLPTG
jgi:hypothetical protein